MRMGRTVSSMLLVWAWTLGATDGPAAAQVGATGVYDVVIVGGTPGGIMAAIAAARCGATAVILDRNAHIGGLPANGLGATDIHTRGATRGLFTEFVSRVRRYYASTYGEDSQQVKQCSDGYHFEPSVAEKVFEQMLAEHKDKVTVLRRRQFDSAAANVMMKAASPVEITVLNRDTGALERYAGRIFIDATYEGDLAAAAGAPFRLGRESHEQYGEPMAGKIYVAWGSRELAEGSTGEADQAVQAYNYRLCLTNRPDNRVPITRPDNYNRQEYASLADDVRLGRTTGPHRYEAEFDGIGRVVNMVNLPNGKTDANNQHLAFISTDLPEENWPWPTADWAWRDRFAQRLRDYTLGLLWFAQNDELLPEDFRRRASAWGLARDEYPDNGHFPRQVYVREGRRIEGEHLFTAHDAIAARGSVRPPVYASSITSSHYALDSHAVRKREPGRVHLDGFFSYPTEPYTVPYGVIVPKKVDGLLTPVPVSGTHVGFSSLRMEPCWMALGQAAGVAAALSIRDGIRPRDLCPWRIQQVLLAQGASLIYFKDAKPGDAGYEALQFFALRGLVGRDSWEACLAEPVSQSDAAQWTAWVGAGSPAAAADGKTTRGQFLAALFDLVRRMPPEKADRIRAPAAQ